MKKKLTKVVQGNRTTYYYNGLEWWTEYDKQGKEIHFKNSEGYEEWTEYKEDGNQIHYKNSDGLEWWSEYDKQGKKCILRTLKVISLGKKRKK